jgi:hypothetical protein
VARPRSGASVLDGIEITGKAHELTVSVSFSKTILELYAMGMRLPAASGPEKETHARRRAYRACLSKPGAASAARPLDADEDQASRFHEEHPPTCISDSRHGKKRNERWAREYNFRKQTQDTLQNCCWRAQKPGDPVVRSGIWDEEKKGEQDSGYTCGARPAVMWTHHIMKDAIYGRAVDCAPQFAQNQKGRGFPRPFFSGDAASSRVTSLPPVPTLPCSAPQS